MTDLKNISHECLSVALEELNNEADALGAALAKLWPIVPAPRAPRRCITPSLYLSWDPKKYDYKSTSRARDVGQTFYEYTGIRYLVRRHKNGKVVWEEPGRDVWVRTLISYLRNPRLVVRCLARMDSFTRWFTSRKKGIESAYKNKRNSQKYWEDRLLARHTLIDMGGKSRVNILPNGMVGVTEAEYCEAANGKKVTAITMTRARTKCGVVEAKRAVEYALQVGGPTNNFIF